MSKFLKELDQRLWKNDVHTYWRYKEIASRTTSVVVLAHCKTNMDRVQARWPNHKME